MIKGFIKSILKWIGVYKIVSSVRFNIKYGNRNDYTLKYKSIELKYSCTDPYSKRWFYPRYDNGKTHEPAIIDFLLRELKPSSCFIDVGANLGFFTCVGGYLCKDGSVHAFEMDPKCMALIEKNVALNNLGNATIVNAAVSDHVGHEKIPNLETPNPRLMIVSEGEGANILTVDSIALDEYVKMKGINPTLIKIDAEGAELKVLTGMKQLLSNNELSLLVEIHCEKIKQFNSNFKDVLNILESNNFSFEEIVSHRGNQIQTRSLTSSSHLEGNVMVFASKRK